MLCHKTIKRSLRVPVEPFGPSTTRDLGSIDTEFGPKAMLAGFLSGMLEIFSEAIRKAPALEEVQLCAQQPPDLLMERGKAVLPEELADSPLVLRRIRRSPENVLPDLPHIEDLLDEAEKWTIRLFDLPCTELQQEIESSRAILAQLRVSYVAYHPRAVTAPVIRTGPTSGICSFLAGLLHVCPMTKLSDWHGFLCQFAGVIC